MKVTNVRGGEDEYEYERRKAKEEDVSQGLGVNS
jgi:hypothetical protein